MATLIIQSSTQPYRAHPQLNSWGALYHNLVTGFSSEWFRRKDDGVKLVHLSYAIKERTTVIEGRMMIFVQEPPNLFLKFRNDFLCFPPHRG